MLGAADAAQAACVSSSPSTQTFEDSVDDAEVSTDGATWAPEIGHVTVSVDAACMLTVNAAISAQAELFLDDYAFIWLNTDGDPATGETLFGGADRGVRISGRTGADNLAIGRYSPASASFTWTTHPSLSAVAMAGIKASIDTLEIAPGTSIGVEASTMTIYGSETLSDLAPDAGPSFRHTVQYSTVVPTPTPTPPPPPPPPPTPTATPVVPTPSPTPRPAPLVKLTSQLTWEHTAFKRYTILRALTMKGVPAGAEVTVTCSGTSCPKRRAVYRTRKAGRVVLSAFRGKKLRVGTKLEVQVTKPGALTQVKRVTIRANQRPRVQDIS